MVLDNQFLQHLIRNLQTDMVSIVGRNSLLLKYGTIFWKIFKTLLITKWSLFSLLINLSFVGVAVCFSDFYSSNVCVMVESMFSF